MTSEGSWSGVRCVPNMTTVNVHEAKTHLSRLLERVQAGEQITITKAGRPVARLIPVVQRPAKRPLGVDRGLTLVGPDWNDPLLEFFERPRSAGDGGGHAHRH